MASTKRLDEKYGKQEADRRFSAALRGAFRTPPKPLKSMTRKGGKAQRKRKARKA